MDYNEFVAKRVAALRQQLDFTANDVSLSIGQNRDYISNIESRTKEPSLAGIICICEFFRIKPHEFFDEGNHYPEQINRIVEDMKMLNDAEFKELAAVVREMVKKKQNEF